MAYSMIASVILMLIIGAGAVFVVLLIHVSNLNRTVKDLSARMAALEAARRAPSAPPPPPTPSEAPAQATGVAQPPPPTPPPPPPPDRPAQPFPLPKKPDWNLEAMIGGNWFNRVGIVLVILCVGFFLKYAFDNQWIGETGRVMLGLIAGLGFLGFGEWYRKKGYPRFSQGLTGGGIGILYLSVYAAFGFYHLIPQVPAFIFMILVTAASVALAVFYRAQPIAMLASLGGFLTPFLLSTGVDNQVGLFSYILLLNLGILAVAYYRNWPLLNYQNFIFTVITFAAWAEKFYEPGKLWTTVFFLTALFLVFAFLAILYNIINKRKATAPELILAFLNAGLYFGAMYFLLEDKYEAYLGLFSLAMGSTYVVLAYLTNARHEEDRFLVWVFLGLAATFVTLAVPIQLKQNWITVGWAVEGAILTYIAFRYDSNNTKLAVLAILVLVFFRLIFFDSNLPYSFVKDDYLLLLNKRVFSYLVGIAAILYAAYCFAGKSKDISTQTRAVAGCLLIGANFLALLLLSVEAHDLFRHLKFQERIDARVYRYAQQLSLSLIWGLYATFLIVVGIWKKYAPVRYMALLLFVLTILKVFFYDLAELRGFYRIISFGVMGMILIAVSFLFQKYKDIIIGTEPEGGEAE